MKIGLIFIIDKSGLIIDDVTGAVFAGMFSHLKIGQIALYQFLIQIKTCIGNVILQREQDQKLFKTQTWKLEFNCDAKKLIKNICLLVWREYLFEEISVY